MFKISDSGLYEEQVEVLYRVLDFFTDPSQGQILTLSANAGTGKSYTMRNVMQCASANGLSLSAGAFTGRACTQLNDGGITASTLHSILLQPRFDAWGDLIGWDDKPKNEILAEIGDGIILDEASFIPLDLYLKFVDLGVKILNCGDVGQLPSISIDGKGGAIEFNAMTDTTDKVLTLEKNRRFDEESGIGKIASHLRIHNSIPVVTGDDVAYVDKKRVFSEMFHRNNEYDVVACGYNNSRHELNALIRHARGFYEDIPEVGEKVMCLKNNVTEKGDKVYNGEIYTVEWVTKGSTTSTFLIRSECGRYTHTVKVLNLQWVNEDAIPKNGEKGVMSFGFGYALTVHRLQGSTLKNVLIVDENVSGWVDQKKWRYTGCTRASDHLTIAM